DDRDGEADGMRQRERADIAAITIEDPEEKIGWAEYDAEAALNRAMTTADTATRAALIDAAVTAVLILDHDDFLRSPGTSRRAVTGAVRALAEADLSDGDPDRRAQLRRTVDAAVASQPADGPTRALLPLWTAEA